MFTYGEEATDLLNTLRDEIGDTKEAPEGVFPEGENFGDNRLIYLYNDEGQHLGRFTARCCELLGRAYARYPTATRLGPSDETVKAVDYFKEEARRLRQLYGWHQSLSPRNPYRGGVETQVRP